MPTAEEAPVTEEPKQEEKPTRQTKPRTPKERKPAQPNPKPKPPLILHTFRSDFFIFSISASGFFIMMIMEALMG
ncbi:hypothetical protein DVH24_031515 [Malus domestica]|uniref:Uncharacterized protein n=1 Tax=Malus domestica TaxID=3750 RepID=A0A498KPC8_MALDO|nr:hypothetical protein DVH24_031515 [Malus domestica]